MPSLPRQDDAHGANDYAPDNVVDGDIRTAWVEGVPGLARGAQLRFRLPNRVPLARVRLVNGYAKSTAVLLDNAAPKTVLIEIVSAYRGDRFQDLAISEIWFFATASS